MTRPTCPTTGLDADVCFGVCCVPLTAAEEARAKLRDEISEALWDSAEAPSDPIGALEAVAVGFAARMMQAEADELREVALRATDGARWNPHRVWTWLSDRAETLRASGGAR